MPKKVKKEGNIHIERAKYGITQQQLGDAIGVSRQTIHTIERGDSIPGVGLCLKMAQFFKTSVEYLVNDI